MSRCASVHTAFARASFVLMLTFASLHAGALRAETTRCVDTALEFLAALDEAEEDQTRINVVRGTYTLGRSYGIVADHGITVVGGWDAGCNQRLADPRLTLFTGLGWLDLRSVDSIRIESLAFVDFGDIYLSANHEGDSVTLRRVWFDNLCPAERCGSEGTVRPVRLFGEYVNLDHVVAIGQGPVGCAITIDNEGLREAFVSHSLFTQNEDRGLCVQQLLDGPNYNNGITVVVDNSVFWNNGGHDVYMFPIESSQITLRNNIYQSLDIDPGISLVSQQTLNADPQFLDAPGQDFRLQASSPAIDSGRFTLQSAQEFDLVGNRRLIGEAPDRGPFETNAAETPLLVNTTQDTTSPVTVGSLRWAIEQANARPGLDHIRFALSGCPRIIELSALLPDITDSVFIDGYSQAGSERNASVRGFTPTLCIGLRDSALALDHALRVPAGATDNTLLWVGGLAFGGFDIAAVRIAAGSNTWVFGNQFGGSLGGTALGNNAVNVRLGGTSHDNLIGGAELSQRNLIAHAYSAGVQLLTNGSGAEGHSNTVRNNFIGLAANGQDAAANALGVLVRTDRNRIEDNWIGGNTGDGVRIEGELAFDNEVRDNAIGRKTFDFCLPPCTPDLARGNGGAGVRVVGASDRNLIRLNRIHYNGGAGIRLEDGVRNLLYANSITANDELGIDLGAVGVNPVYNTGLAVTATYANEGINAPVLSSASGDGDGGTVTGQIVGSNGDYVLELYRNVSCDASGRGEGLEPLNSANLSINNAPLGNNGDEDFEIVIPAFIAMDGSTLTAVLRSEDGSTSEFSACRTYQTIACREIFKDGLEDNPPPAQCTPL